MISMMLACPPTTPVQGSLFFVHMTATMIDLLYTPLHWPPHTSATSAAVLVISTTVLQHKSKCSFHESCSRRAIRCSSSISKIGAHMGHVTRQNSCHWCSRSQARAEPHFDCHWVNKNDSDHIPVQGHWTRGITWRDRHRNCKQVRINGRVESPSPLPRFSTITIIIIIIVINVFITVLVVLPVSKPRWCIQSLIDTALISILRVYDMSYFRFTAFRCRKCQFIKSRQPVQWWSLRSLRKGNMAFIVTLNGRNSGFELKLNFILILIDNLSRSRNGNIRTQIWHYIDCFSLPLCLQHDDVGVTIWKYI